MTVTHRGTQFQAIVPLQQKSFTQLGPSGSGAVTVSYSVGHLTVTGIDSSGDTLFVRELEYTPLPLSDDGIREAVLEMQIVPAMAEARRTPSGRHLKKCSGARIFSLNTCRRYRTCSSGRTDRFGYAVKKLEGR